ncbi:MAG TPA: maltose alpha-D-glucosyltransferase [Gemmataceae bacterium]|nr:maltose alpha-D-glucosyltransferase [Gemmataceae bacterium]
MKHRGHFEKSHVTDDPLWYKDAIIYELHVRAFHDSNGDGIGDFRGLLEKLDYLEDLGITAVWLLPFYPSPLRDDGYDISDYTDVNPIYGNLTDFKAVLREAHRRGIRIITELVINHTSDQHPWFQRARLAPRDSVHRNYYVWNETPDKFQEARIIFKDFEHSNWTWDATAKAFYWHRFYGHQPDLNYDCPAVQRAVIDTLDFWLDLGIDGLRLDAIPYLYEREGTSCENLPETHAFLRILRQHVDTYYPGRMLLSEANQWPEDAVAYFGNGDESHMAFHFPVMPRLFMAIRMEDRFPIIDILQQTPAIPMNSQWALFLRNHDELTLEMVTDEDRDYMYRVYAQDTQARINLGIRRRLAPLLENHRGKIELMNGLLFSLPGTPVLYYGDEIGMGDNIFLGERNGGRTPMQWSPERNAGFSNANPQRLYLPVVIDPEYHYQATNVETQQNNPHSLLWWMKKLIALRKRHQAFGRGSLEFLLPDNHKVLAFVRKHESEQILVVANLSRVVQPVVLDLAAYKGAVPVEMLGRSRLPAIGEGKYQLTLGPFAFYWLLLERPVTSPRLPETETLPALEVAGVWQNLFDASTIDQVERVLPAYLQRQSWFAGHGDLPTATRVVDNIPIGRGDAWVMLVQVEFSTGEPKQFVLPVTFRKDPEGSNGAAIPEGVRIARLTVKPGEGETDQTGILFDALADRGFAQTLLEAFTRHRRYRGASGELLARTTPACHRLRGMVRSPAEPMLIKAEHCNTAIAYGDQFVLKFFRWIDEGINPEIEISQALAEKTNFAHAAPLAGTLTFYGENRPPTTLASLSTFVHNEGDAWQYTVDSLRRFFEHVLTRRENRPDPAMPGGSYLDAVKDPMPPLAQELIGSYLEAAALMGRRAAQFHLALASIADNPAFTPEAFTSGYQRSTYQSARNWVYRIGQLLRSMAPSLHEKAQADARVVLGREGDIIQYLRGIVNRRINVQRIRCHGDFRLSSLLYTGRDFVIINLDGEVLRPLNNRRLKRSSLRDVAGWLHSQSCAILTVLHEEHLRLEDRPTLEPWARYWQRWVSTAFVRSYLETAGHASFVPRTHDDLQSLLDYCLLGRAIYDVRYHLLNRPERVQVPLRALLLQLQDRDRRQVALPPR